MRRPAHSRSPRPAAAGRPGGASRKPPPYPPGATLAQVGEFGFLDLLRSALGNPRGPVELSLGDDAALLRPREDFDLVLTTDLMVEGRHFDFAYTSPFDLGAKAMASNVSDCAAMGAAPLAALVSLAAPGDFPVESALRLFNGLKGWAEAYGARIVGGDTSAADKVVVNVALVGEVERGKALRRGGAREGDAVVVTGTLGDAAAGLHALQNREGADPDLAAPLIRRHLTPTPRFAAGRLLATRGLATSCIDLSDGLAGDVGHLCAASGVGVEIHEEGLPFSEAFRAYCAARGLDPVALALTGGEDYELLFTVPVDRLSQVLRGLSAECGVPCRSVGRVVKASKGRTLIRRNGATEPLAARAFDHYGKGL